MVPSWFTHVHAGAGAPIDEAIYKKRRLVRRLVAGRVRASVRLPARSNGPLGTKRKKRQAGRWQAGGGWLLASTDTRIRLDVHWGSAWEA